MALAPPNTATVEKAQLLSRKRARHFGATYKEMLKKSQEKCLLFIKANFYFTPILSCIVYKVHAV
jgi:hypothetical protein